MITTEQAGYNKAVFTRYKMRQKYSVPKTDEYTQMMRFYSLPTEN